MPLADSIKKLLLKMVYVQCIRKLLRFLFYFRVLVNINELIGKFSLVTSGAHLAAT